MKNTLEQMKYPGRGIVMGAARDGEVFCAYFVTGRSKSSQARRLVINKNSISTEPTDSEKLAKGNPDLLIYNAILWTRNLIVVSNGKHTDTILSGTLCSKLNLNECTRQWNYEPDAPNNTPRISGRIQHVFGEPEDYLFELGIIRKKPDSDSADRQVVVLNPLADVEMNARGITTYHGGNESPLEPFRDTHFELDIEAVDPEGICRDISDMIDPKYLVGVACVKVIGHQIKPYVLNSN